MPLFEEIPQLLKPADSHRYPLTEVARILRRYSASYGLRYHPPYQRGYVWSDAQKIAYVEHLLRGGASGLDIYFAMYEEDGKRVMELVDGKQRLYAVTGFFGNMVQAYGHYYSDYQDVLSAEIQLNFHIAHNLTPEQICEWYIAINTGGTVHTDEDLRVAYNHLASLQGNENV